jgi:hypothetical protein
MGPNESWNLAAGDRSANGLMETLEASIERKIKGPAPTSTSEADDRIRWYETKVTFWPAKSDIPYNHLFLRTVAVREGRFNPSSRAAEEITHGPWTSQEPPPTFTAKVVNFSSSGHEVIGKALDPRTGELLGSNIGQKFVDARRLLAEATGGQTGGRRQWDNTFELSQYLRQAHLGQAKVTQVLELLKLYPEQFVLK